MKKLELPPQGLNTLFGVQDQNIKYLESLLDVTIGARGNELLLDGDPKDIHRIDRALKQTFPKDRALRRWVDLAERKIPFTGLPARIGFA